MQKLIYTMLAIVVFQLSNAQLSQIKSLTDTFALKTFQYEWTEKALLNKAIAVSKAKEMGWVIRQELPDGQIMEIMGLDAFGQPEYFITNNTAAAATIGTRHLHPGGNTGLNLSGEDMTIGEWDGGAVRVGHRELTGRVTQNDGASSVSDHATHVAGTLIASGVSANAKGMAYSARLLAHDWNLDAIEMAAAAINGLLISNHSYGTITGWRFESGSWRWYGTPSVNQTYDYKFGFYDARTRDWDQIARNAPYYLIVKSAGNDRNEGPNAGATHQVLQNGVWVNSTTTRSRDGLYDCISTYSTAKNILTVGAVNDLNNGYQTAAGVNMSSFSGWGPTDDGRIKPDVTGNGVGLFSSTGSSTSSYSSYSGTSMSSPNVAGTLLLIQEHYNNLNGAFMLAATLKALAIHTADEAGPSTGPDYMFGWGLVNAAKAASVITNTNAEHLIKELTLNNEQVMEMSVYSNGNSPIKATICWTDLPGTPGSPSYNDRTPKLVNDLDLRMLYVKDDETFLPWILDPENPSAAAVKGDNFRDNVEVINIAAPQKGRYIIRINHKDNLRNSNPQNFSLILSGLTPPSVSASFTTSSTEVCAGGNVSFNNTSSSPVSDDLLYTWEFEGGSPATSTATNPTVSYTEPGTYPVKLIAYLDEYSDTILQSAYVTVLPVLVPAVSLETSSTSICAGEEILFTANTTHSGSNPNYTWYLNDEKIDGESLSSLLLSSVEDADRIKVALLSDALCANPTSVLSEDVVVSVTENVLPSVSINIASSDICVGTPANFMAEVINGGMNPSYIWQLNGETLSEDTASITLENLVDGDIVNAFLISDAFCRLSDTAFSNTITMTIFEKPEQPVLTKSSDTLFATPGFDTYEWYLDGVLLTTTNVPYLKVLVSGNYSVSIKNDDDCSATSEAFNFILSGQTTFSNAGITLYPNPAESIIYIQTGDLRIRSLSMLDMSGKEVLSKILTKNEPLLSVDIAELGSGAYLLLLTDESFVYSALMIRK